MVRKKNSLFRINITLGDFGDDLENPRNVCFAGRLWRSSEIRPCHRKQTQMSPKPSQGSRQPHKTSTACINCNVEASKLHTRRVCEENSGHGYSHFLTLSYWRSEETFLLAALFYEWSVEDLVIFLGGVFLSLVFRLFTSHLKLLALWCALNLTSTELQ